jgi:methionyl-tRNA formyltransferase
MNKIVFMGTPAFAVPTLQYLCQNEMKPALCISQPDKEKGRNRKLQPTDVKKCALQYEIPVFQPEDVNSIESIEVVKNVNPEIIITVAYGGFLNKEIRTIPKFGCINLHPSLLPKYRGSAPINYALFEGEQITGCTIFRLTARMDAGPILFQSELPIAENECFTELSDRLALQGAKDVLQTLHLLTKGTIAARKQDHKNASFSRKLEKKDLLLNWDINATDLQNKVRGLAMKPGLTASFRDKLIKILSVEKLEEKSTRSSGSIISVIKNKGICAATNDYNVLITKVQPMGKAIMEAYAFHLGARIQVGERFADGF